MRPILLAILLSFLSNLGEADTNSLLPSPQSQLGQSSKGAYPQNNSVTAHEFGAIPGDAIDDTAAIQAAIDSGAENLYVGPGEYRISKLTISRPIRIYGPGQLTRTTPESAPVVEIRSSDVTIDGISLYGHSRGSPIKSMIANDLAIKATGDHETRPLRNLTIRNVTVEGFGWMGIYISYAKNVTIERCSIKYIGYAGIVFLSVEGGAITDNVVDTVSSSGPVNWYGISLTRDPGKPVSMSIRTTNIRIAHNIVKNIPNWTGIDIHAGSNCVVEGNRVSNTKNGMYAQYDNSSAPYPQPSEDIAFNGNIIEGGEAATQSEVGISSLGMDRLPNRRIAIIGNTISRVGSYSSAAGAIAVRSTIDSEIRDNRIFRAIRNGISIYGMSADSLVEGNIVDGVRDGAAPNSRSYLWIDLVNQATIRILRNRLVNTTGDSAYSPTYGVLYNGAVSEIEFHENTIQSLSGMKFLQKIGGSANVFHDFRWEDALPGGSR